MTKDEVVFAFSPAGKLTEVQKTKIMKIENAFKDVATDIVDLVPCSADRSSALRKLLDAKFTCVQAITHDIEPKVLTKTKN